jgi:signal transduction histidine kinase
MKFQLAASTHAWIQGPDELTSRRTHPRAQGGRLSHEYLGLFDTPPSRGENALALAIVGALFVAFLAVLPVANIQLGEVSPFIPTISVIIFVGELIVATLLFAQAAVFRSRALTVLASGYVFTALLLIPYALTFPGAFATGGLLHPGPNTTAWLMIVRRWAEPLSVIGYVLLKQADSGTPPDLLRAPAPVSVYVSAAAALAAAWTIFTIVGRDLLPPLFANRSDSIFANLFLVNLSMVALLAIAMGMLLWRRTSILDTWLLVSLAAVLIQSLLNVMLQARFMLGWYFLFVLMLFSHLSVLLALIAESNRLYVRLALSTAARNRERDARMMSIDVVAAAISHEIGQPLTAASLSASAALNSLTRARPDSEMAIKSLRDTVRATQRAFAVARSVRAMFGKRTNSVSEFNLNDLVRETAALLDREMAAQRVSLRLTLDAALPPVLANRIQIQRVLINLLMNAIESLGATERRGRRIAIRSATGDHETLQVEISDSGVGIAPETMAQIFEPFFSTKSSGTGLGLSLSRTIVESHGGRLWASPAEDGGATFHLELPRSPLPKHDSGARAETTTI